MSNPERVAAGLGGWIERTPDGELMTRPAECGCGTAYTQYRVALKFVESLAAGRGEAAAQRFMADIPGGWVPVYCPRCERKDLAMLGNRVHFPPLPDERRGAA